MKLPRHAEIWVMPYVRDRLRKSGRPKPKRAWVAITDHYEPLGTGASHQTALQRVGQWRDKWPNIAHKAPRDSGGLHAQYTFFYPQEDYKRDLIESLAEITRLGMGDVEVHMHHENEKPDAFRKKITDF